MDDRWEKKITEFGAINITGFRIVDFTRRFVRNFSEMWKRETISVRYFNNKDKRSQTPSRNLLLIMINDNY